MASFLMFLSVDTANRTQEAKNGSQGSELGVGGGERHRLVSILGFGLVIVVGALVNTPVHCYLFLFNECIKNCFQTILGANRFRRQKIKIRFYLIR